MRNIWWSVAIAFLLVAGPVRAYGANAPTLAPDDIFLGKADAPVTVFEYASLSCPHCGEFDTDILPLIKKNWIDTGKARLVYRDYPLDGVALKAAMLTRCVPKDRFFDFVNELFHTQRNWVLAKDPMAALQRIALLGGIGKEKFEACMNDKALENRILGERLTASKDYEINSTPTFFVNGTKIVGALPYPQFAEALAAALGNKPVPQSASGPSTPAAPSAGH